VDDYYVDASSHIRVNNVSVPLLCVNSIDDAVVCGEGMPIYDSNNQQTVFVMTETGGHLGWIENTGISALREGWVDKLVKQFFQQLK
jgi:predicted alpha/beta-fold hydrolase